MGVLTSDSFQSVGERSQIMVCRVEEDIVIPKVREPLCEVPSSFTVLSPVFTDHGRGQGRPRASSQTR